MGFLANWLKFRRHLLFLEHFNKMTEFINSSIQFRLFSFNGLSDKLSIKIDKLMFKIDKSNKLRNDHFAKI